MTITPISTINSTQVWNNEIGLIDRMPEFEKEVGVDRILVLMKHGSHLYGTNGPTSDLDLKGVFMPTALQISLGKIPHAYTYTSKKSDDVKNTSKDIDIQIFSLHYFIEMACKGETISIDMLHARDEQCIVWSKIWQKVFDDRSMFYTRNMTAFVGYARSQAAKYGIKGSRIDAVSKVLDYLNSKMEDPGKIGSVWDELPDGEHIHKMEPNPRDKNNNKIYQVCGKQFLESTPFSQIQACLQKFNDEYGVRARQAQENKGIDWKAVSHALRAAYQLKEIFETGDLKFPLQAADLLRGVKKGEYQWERAQGILEAGIQIVESLSRESTLPEKVNRNEIDKFLSQETIKSITHPLSIYG